MSPAHLIYLSAFISPFIQEDAAIWGAVTACFQAQTSQVASGPLILLSMFVGLVISDLWKYWIGWAGRHQGWAQRTARRQTVQRIGTKIVTHPGKMLMIARFVPGTRVPAYIAAGFFGVPFGLFSIWIIMSGMAYTGFVWALLYSVGEVAGKTGQLYAAGIMLSLLVVYGAWSMVEARKA